MTKTKLGSFLLAIGVAILFAGSNDLYAGGGTNPWGTGTAPKGSTPWTGTLVITGQIANVPGLPPGLPPDAVPTISAQYKDLIVKIEFFVRLENSKRGYGTFSGLAKDNDGYYFFYALSDYANGRIGEALNRFLTERVYPNLPGNQVGAQGVLTSVTEDIQNVGEQLRVDQVSGRENLQPETPLYYNAKIAVATY